MDRLAYVTHRVAFSGLPFGEWQAALAAVRTGQRWAACFRLAAHRLRALAHRAEAAGRVISAAQAWQWVACAYQAATFVVEEEPAATCLHSLSHLRRLARGAYLRALRLDSRLGRPVAIPVGPKTVLGYLRVPAQPHAPLAVLFNGLDSICEVELHAFGTWFRARGLGVLALDLPAALAAARRHPCFAVERLAPVLADWVAQQPRVAHSPLGAFGVSFGGHLVARLLAGDARFTAGVAVSPAAWLGPQELQAARIRQMLAWTFDLPDGPMLLAMARRIRLDGVPPPAGRLRVYQMDHDALFGPDHAEALLAWGREAVEIQRLGAEHVGTSLVHQWLPEAVDWLSEQLTGQAMGREERRWESCVSGRSC